MRKKSVGPPAGREGGYGELGKLADRWQGSKPKREKWDSSEKALPCLTVHSAWRPETATLGRASERRQLSCIFGGGPCPLFPFRCRSVLAPRSRLSTREAEAEIERERFNAPKRAECCSQRALAGWPAVPGHEGCPLPSLPSKPPFVRAERPEL